VAPATSGATTRPASSAPLRWLRVPRRWSRRCGVNRVLRHCGRSRASTPSRRRPMPEGNGPLPLAVVVLTRDEERHLPDCLASVQGPVTAGALLFVLDTANTDHTVAVSRRIGARVAGRPLRGYASARQAPRR